MTVLRTLSASFLATAALAASASLALAIPAHASAPAAASADEAALSLGVNYGDLNLDTPEGRAKLQHRIVRAASDVCEDWRNVGTSLQGQVAFSHCRDAAMSHANARLAEKLATAHLAMH
jgi:UrcA family protein